MQQCSWCSLMNSKQWRRIAALDPCLHGSSDLRPCKGAHGSQGADPQWWISAAVFCGQKNWELWRDEQGGGKKLVGTSITLVIHGFRADFLRQVPEMPNWNSRAALPLCQPLAHKCEFSGINGNGFGLAESVCGVWVLLVGFGVCFFFSKHVDSSSQQLLLNQGVSCCFFVIWPCEQFCWAAKQWQSLCGEGQDSDPDPLISQPAGQIAKWRDHMERISKSRNPALHTD